jgi:hypothetical protein
MAVESSGWVSARDPQGDRLFTTMSADVVAVKVARMGMYPTPQ